MISTLGGSGETGTATLRQGLPPNAPELLPPERQTLRHLLLARTGSHLLGSFRSKIKSRGPLQMVGVCWGPPWPPVRPFLVLDGACTNSWNPGLSAGYRFRKIKTGRLFVAAFSGGSFRPPLFNWSFATRWLQVPIWPG